MSPSVATHVWGEVMLAAEYYEPIFYNAILGMTVLACIALRSRQSRRLVDDGQVWMLGMAVVLFLGLRPVSPVFGDTVNYAVEFDRVGAADETSFEWAFAFLMRLCASQATLSWFFLLCAAIYVLPVVIAFRKRHPAALLEGLLVTLGSFSFFPYGVNGIRSGLAASLFIAAVANMKDRFRMGVLMVLATGMHKSAFLAVAAFLATGRVTSPRFWMRLWVAAFLLSAVAGSTISNSLGALPWLAGDERASLYFGDDAETGAFRPDFILYSIAPVLLTEWLAGGIEKADRFQLRLRNTYLALNICWLLLMRAAFTNRFAYLSWSLQPWLIVYPFLGGRLVPTSLAGRRLDAHRRTVLAGVLLANVGFTYLMMMYVYPSRAE